MATPVHAVEHYENFPVASWLVPGALRPAIVAVYRFARHADDIADEGDAEPGERLAALARLHAAIERAQRGEPVDEPTVADLLAPAQRHGFDWDCFHALLSAFEQDVTVTRYRDRASLLDYCRRSADPVGRLVLAVFGVADPASRSLSDRICTALQLVNFAQDVAIDWRRGRLYLPLDELARHGAGEADLDRAVADGHGGPALRACIGAEAAFARALLTSGAALATRVPARLGWELRAIVAGGLQVLARLERGGSDPFTRRPRLGARDALPLAARMLRLAFAR